jgi:valyl-tRNA synthetase
MPFVTEEVWSLLPQQKGLLACETWPSGSESLIDTGAEAQMQDLMTAVTNLRQYRDEVAAPASAWLPARLNAEGYVDTQAQLARLARFSFTADNSDDDGNVAASVVIPGGVVEVLGSEVVDPQEARQRMQRRRQVVEQEIARAEGKLANEGFVNKAPAELVEQERRKLERFKQELGRLS